MGIEQSSLDSLKVLLVYLMYVQIDEIFARAENIYLACVNSILTFLAID